MLLRFLGVLLAFPLFSGALVQAALFEEPTKDRNENGEVVVCEDSALAESECEEQAQESDQKSDAEEIEELRRQLEIVVDEVEKIRSGEDDTELTVDEARALGLAPSAAATYGIERGVSIAGYGEMLYENYASDTTTKFDFLRAILYTGYRFNDKFLFNSEIEVEHAKEIYVEFAYLDYLAHENFGIRGGMLLAPMGLVNEFHEPTVFLGAERPVTEQRIIPSTWRENGGGIYGSFGDKVAYRAYLINGFNGSKFSSKGVRGGRQKGGKAKANHMAFTGRVDITPTPGVFFGASLYSGGSGQGDIVVNDKDLAVRTTIFDLHGQVQVRGFDLRGLYAKANIDDAAGLNEALGLTGSSGVAESMEGAYIQFGYDVLSQIGTNDVAFTPYVRLERVDTQASMPSGFTRSASTKNNFLTLGVELKPIPNIVVKVDHAWVTNDADSGVNQFNVNLGYAF